MFNWFWSIFKKRETPVEQARRLGKKYIKLTRATTGEPVIKNGLMFVIDVASDTMVYIPVEEYERYNKTFSRDQKLNSILD
jgi:hypothetical protein